MFRLPRSHLEALARPGTLVIAAAWCAIAAATPREVARTTAEVERDAITPAATLVGAFPGCEGSGCRTRGGFDARTGPPRIHRVTRLADGTGPGTLGRCIAGRGPRVCLFAVSGTIRTAGYTISNPFITIDGASAPGGGIQLSGEGMNIPRHREALLLVTTHDVVVRGLRLRAGSNYRRDYAIMLYQQSAAADIYNVVVDHNSISWAHDTLADAWGRNFARPPRDFTYSYNIIAEPIRQGPKPGDAQGQLFGGGPRGAVAMVNCDTHHNYYASIGYRAPRFLCRSGRIVNNLVYNWGYWGPMLSCGTDADLIGNAFKRGPMTRYNPLYLTLETNDGNCPGGDPANPTKAPRIAPTYYIEGNKYVGDPEPEPGANWTDPGTGLMSSDSIVDKTRNRYARNPYVPLPPSSSGFPITVQPASELAAALLGDGGAGASRRLDCAGAFVTSGVRDTVDRRLVAEYESGTQGTTPVDVRYIQTVLGGWPAIADVSSKVCAANERDNAQCVCGDSDRDGMPDYWETGRCGKPNACEPLARSVAPPWTDLEAFLSGQHPAR